MLLLIEQGGHALHLELTLFDLHRRPTFEHFRHLERLHLELTLFNRIRPAVWL